MCGGSSGCPTASGRSDAARDHTDLASTEAVRVGRERSRRADHDPRPPQDRAEQPRQPLGELDVRAPESGRRAAYASRGRRGRREPVGVHDIGVACRAPCREREREEKQRQKQDLPRPCPEVVRDPVPVGDPEVPERRGRDDVDVDTGLAQMDDGVLHEPSGDVARVARVRGCQDGNVHRVRLQPQSRRHSPQMSARG